MYFYIVFSRTTVQHGNNKFIDLIFDNISSHIFDGIHFFLSHNITSLNESDCVNKFDKWFIEILSYFTHILLNEGNEASIRKAEESWNNMSETDFVLVTLNEFKYKHFRPKFNNESEHKLPNSCELWISNVLIICNLLLIDCKTSLPVCDGNSRDKWFSTEGNAFIILSICAESHLNDGVYFKLFNDGKLLRQPKGEKGWNK